MLVRYISNVFRLLSANRYQHAGLSDHQENNGLRLKGGLGFAGQISPY